MNRRERIEHLIMKGATCNPELGLVYGNRGKELISRDSKGYKYIFFMKDSCQYRVSQHQFIWYWVNKTCVDQIDHINGIRDDNRICNLREVNNQKNQFNRMNVKGYYYHKSRSKWMSYINIDGERIHLGYHELESDARQAYLDAKIKYHIF